MHGHLDVKLNSDSRRTYWRAIIASFGESLFKRDIDKRQAKRKLYKGLLATQYCTQAHNFIIIYFVYFNT